MASFLKIIYTLLSVFILWIIIEIIGFSQIADETDNDYNNEFRKNYAIYALDLPKTINFAGERVPLENYDVRESLDRELMVNTYWQSQTLLFLKRANRHFPMIEKILDEHGIPDDFKYIALAESGLINVISPAGAVGAWQFLKETAKEYGLEVNGEVDERYNLKKSTKAACRYFKESYEHYGNWTMVAASYNMGRANLNKQIKRQKANYYYDMLLNEETSRYIFRVIAIKIIMSNPEKYGFHYRKKDLYQPIPTYEVAVDTAVEDFAEFANEYSVNYKILKYFNPWLRDCFLKNRNNKTYYITIPEKGYRNIDLDQYEYVKDSLEKLEETD